MHEVLVNRLGGLSLPRKSVVRLTDRPDMTIQQQHCLLSSLRIYRLTSVAQTLMTCLLWLFRTSSRVPKKLLTYPSDKYLGIVSEFFVFYLENYMYIKCTYWNRLNKMNLMSTHNIPLSNSLWKIKATHTKCFNVYSVL